MKKVGGDGMKNKLSIPIIITLLIGLIIIIADLNSAAYAQQFSDSSLGLVIPHDVKEYWENTVSQVGHNMNSLLSSVDWSINDSDVKYQGGCGSCWAFAAVALIENIGNKNNLSEQVVVSCATGSCSGGWYGDALKYCHDYGLPPEDCYYYLAQNGNCDDKCEHPEYLEQVANYDYYGRWGHPTDGTVNNLKNLLQSGPVCVSMLVPEGDSFTGYSGDIYDYEGGAISPSRAHAILVVGYDDNEQYFKAKNSWGFGWGENGYFRIAYDDVTDDVQFGGYACTASGIYTSYSTPVELSSFIARVIFNSVKLEWETKTETNNYGFDIERSTDGINYSNIKFIKGYGTTTIPQSYNFSDTDLQIGNYYYRLKQIDFDGQVSYSEAVEVVLSAPLDYSLTQNYPNPFNSETKISFKLPEFNSVSFKIFNALGQEIKTLLQQDISAGYHSVSWNGSDLNGRIVPTGVYYYQIKANNFVETRRLVVLR